ncbi:MAG: DUF805 domain-containing protein [Rhodobacteraceae bacterium]|nr:DUF805 domain-containing protein [Paracoccaceae bacterium]
MDFKTSVTTCLSKYATFSGRARRSELWWFVLFNVILSIIAGILDRMLFGVHDMHMGAADAGMSFNYQPSLIGSVVSLALLLPNLAVAARRMHDIDRSGWWLLIVFIPIIGWLVLLYWYIKEGTQGPNRFGAPA